jgi:hypothetical protein
MRSKSEYVCTYVPYFTIILCCLCTLHKIHKENYLNSLSFELDSSLVFVCGSIIRQVYIEMILTSFDTLKGN